MKLTYKFPACLFLALLASFTSAAPAEIKIGELIMSDSEIATRKSIAGTARILNYFINTETTSEFKTPEEWQYKVIRESTARASSILNISIKETAIQNEADVVVYIHKAQFRDSLSGQWSVDLSINISHQSGLGENKEAIHSAGEQATWRNIFLHELGHFLGLEHPWDKDDGDWAVDEWSDSHASTRMGYNEHLDGSNVWYSNLDIEALESIWGKGEWLSLYNGVTPDSSLELAFNNIGIFNSSDATIYTCLRVFTDGLPGSVGGIGQFDIGFTIYSLPDAIIQVAKSRAFNAANALNENAQNPDCSGKFETTTGIFTDIIQANGQTLETTWSLTDSTNLLLTLQSAVTLEAPASTPKLSALTFNPAKNSKTMPVENNIDITFSSPLTKGEGLITLKDSDGNTVESYQASSSASITITGASLSINPTVILASDKNYSINIPVGALRDSAGNNLGEAIDYDFKTQIDMAYMLLGYNGTTLYETTDAFKATAELATTQMGLLSFNRIASSRTHMLPVSSYDGEYADSKAQIEAIDSALDNWGSDDVFSNFYAEFRTNPNALRDPTTEQISVLNNLRAWLVENQKGAVNWKDTDLGKEHYQWISDKVLLASSSGARFLLDGLRMPAGFEVKEYRAIGIILSSEDSYNTGALASSFNSWGGKHWNISDSDGNKYTHYQPFFYDDHSALSPGGDPEKIKKANAQVIMHEWVHTLGGGHDQDPSCVSPYSFMAACDTGDFFPYPIYNRIYIMGWLPDTAVTTDPSLVEDSYNATDPTKKYLLKLGDSRYQELFNGTWYQYRVPSFEKTLEACKLGGLSFADDGYSIDPLETCGQLVVDKSCVVSSSFYDNELKVNTTIRDFGACEFINVEKDLSYELFAKFLSRLDGSAQDYSGSVDRQALLMEQTNAAARQALSN
ncbi:MAG: Ig-like domain-containing protein [Pseudohongiellaceae bacterium]|uniref:SbsA Ig-like domain-containing protein n=1 Tax=OM182 bacterium MED-G28 TaxID=1986256 RepID=A0A2A5WFQ8_9GAMM|nr:MAG: hypothetical protein CNF02_03435 [OM182 bacterium MED-G28]